MNRMQEQVAEFHAKFGHVIGTRPAISRPELRVKLIREEAKETCDAIEAGDLVEAVDGIADLLYVAIGAAVEFGVDIQPIFDEVHRSNMTKEGGATRADGNNEARYIDEHGHFVCGTCPIRHGDDAIKITDVPELLKLLRKMMRPVDDPAHFKIHSEMIATNPGRTLEAYLHAFRDILGKKPKLP